MTQLTVNIKVILLRLSCKDAIKDNGKEVTNLEIAKIDKLEEC